MNEAEVLQNCDCDYLPIQRIQSPILRGEYYLETSGHFGFYPARCVSWCKVSLGKKKKQFSSNTVSYFCFKQLHNYKVLSGECDQGSCYLRCCHYGTTKQNRAYDPDVQEKYLQSLFTIMFSRIQYFLTTPFCLVKLHISKGFNSFGSIADKLYIRFGCRANTFIFFCCLPIMHSLKLFTLLPIFLFYFPQRGDW